MTAHKLNLNQKTLIITVVIGLIFVTIFLLLGMRTYSRPSTSLTSPTNNVLGIKDTGDEKSFWINFLADNPYYYPGWERLNELSQESKDSVLQAQTEEALSRLKPNLD